MINWTTILLALREIRRNLMRSFLTVLGIVIGVAAVVTMVTLGNGATRSVSDQITSLGSNLLMLRPGQREPCGGPHLQRLGRTLRQGRVRHRRHGEAGVVRGAQRRRRRDAHQAV